MRLNGFFQAKLNGRKPSEKYRNLIPSYNIKGCFLLCSSRVLTYMDLYLCIYETVDILDSTTGRFKSD